MRLYSPLTDKRQKHEFGCLEMNSGLYSPQSTQKRFFDSKSPILNGYHINFFNFSKVKKHFYTELNKNKSKSKVVYPNKKEPIKVKNNNHLSYCSINSTKPIKKPKNYLFSSQHNIDGFKTTAIKGSLSTITIKNKKHHSSQLTRSHTIIYQQQSIKKNEDSIQIRSAKNQRNKTLNKTSNYKELDNKSNCKKKVKKEHKIKINHDDIISANNLPHSIRTQMIITNPYLSNAINNYTLSSTTENNNQDNKSPIQTHFLQTEENRLNIIDQYNKYDSSGQLISLEHKYRHKKTYSENISSHYTKSQSGSSPHSKAIPLFIKNRYRDLLTEYFSDDDNINQFKGEKGISDIKIKVEKVKGKC